MHKVHGTGLLPWNQVKLEFCGLGFDLLRTIARWKSGLFPFVVFAIRVNWETQRISPLISLTLFFHMTEEFEVVSLNTRRDNLGNNLRF